MDSPDAAICARIESPKRVGTKGAGWLHRLRDDHDWRNRPRQRRARLQKSAVPIIDFGALAAECFKAMGPHLRGLLSEGLHISPRSLMELGVGWSHRHRATTWPMTDADGQVRGVRLRRTDGQKFSVRGGREGLFIPSNVPIVGCLVICEGPTDTAALRGLSFEVVGRPSCNGGADLLVEAVEKWQPTEVAVIADADAPGQRGARSLAARLVGYIPGGVRIVTPPAKDAREWVRYGATRLDVLDAIQAAPTMTLTYSKRIVL
jgi:hypothetical protein